MPSGVSTKRDCHISAKNGATNRDDADQDEQHPVRGGGEGIGAAERQVQAQSQCCHPQQREDQQPQRIQVIDMPQGCNGRGGHDFTVMLTMPGLRVDGACRLKNKAQSASATKIHEVNRASISQFRTRSARALNAASSTAR